MATLSPTEDLIEFARRVREPREPAGGWYLLPEQRLWLVKTLVAIIGQGKHDAPIRILEAGVASYIHHYSYLSLLCAVLKHLGDETHIDLTIVDRCVYPIMQIQTIEERLENNESLPLELVVGENRIQIDAKLSEFISRTSGSVDRIRIHSLVRDLSDPTSSLPFGFYDLITEHFLTPVLEVRPDEIARIRKNYAMTLKTGGHLVAASRIKADHPFHSDFQKIHELNGMREVHEVGTLVWNPFASREQIGTSLLNSDKPREVRVPLTDQLSVHKKM